MTNEDQRFDCLQWAQEMNAQYDNFILHWGHVYRDINAIFLIVVSEDDTDEDSHYEFGSSDISSESESD